MHPDTEIILKTLNDYGMDISPDDLSATMDAASRLGARVLELEAGVAEILRLSILENSTYINTESEINGIAQRLLPR